MTTAAAVNPRSRLAPGLSDALGHSSSQRPTIQRNGSTKPSAQNFAGLR